MQILVTGANGHIGSNVVHDLVDSGYDVRALVRSSSDLRAIEGLDIEIVRGDVLVSDSLAAAVDGVDGVFHVAAPYLTWAKDPESILRPCVEGTRNVFRAAADAGVQRIVATSSCNAVGLTDDEHRPRNETQWNENPKSVYLQAKLLAEREAWRIAEELGLELMTVMPTAVLGRFDYRGTPTMKPFVDAINRKGPVPFAMNLVDVRDVAAGHRLAFEKGSPGERYLLGNTVNSSAEEIAALIEEVGGLRPMVGLPPIPILKVVATIGELLAGVTGKPPMISRTEIADAAGKHVVFDCSKARDELGLEPRSPRAVVEETVRWAATMGWLSPKVRVPG